MREDNQIEAALISDIRRELDCAVRAQEVFEMPDERLALTLSAVKADNLQRLLAETEPLQDLTQAPAVGGTGIQDLAVFRQLNFWQQHVIWRIHTLQIIIIDSREFLISNQIRIPRYYRPEGQRKEYRRVFTDIPRQACP